MSYDFQTEEGRRALFDDYIRRKCAEGYDLNRDSTRDERRAFLHEWLHMLLTDHVLDPKKRFPPYRSLAELFSLQESDVTGVVNQLRDERLLPKRKTRKDRDQPVWKDRDLLILEFIADMRAVRFDQVRRLAARESEYETAHELLSESRTSELVKRYTDTRLAVFMPAFANQPGFVYLTRRGLRLVERSEYHADTPSLRLLEHLYWINEVRLHLEDEYNDEQMEWVSERLLQTEQELRQSGQKMQHMPDGVFIYTDDEGKSTEIDIEVQLSKTSPQKIREVMSYQAWDEGKNNPLRYYVNKLARKRVLTTYQAMQREGQPMRPWIQIIDLETWKLLA